MSTASQTRRYPDAPPSALARLRARLQRERWLTSIGLGIGLFAVYWGNLREIGAGDTLPATLLPTAIWRGDGLALNRFASLWAGNLPWYVVEKRGQIVSCYPLTPGLLAVPRWCRRSCCSTTGGRIGNRRRPSSTPRTWRRTAPPSSSR